MNILAFIQTLSNELKCRYSYDEMLTIDNGRYYSTSGIIYHEETPFIIIKDRSGNTEKQNEKAKKELSLIQDYLEIKWSLIKVGGTIHLRHQKNEFEIYDDIKSIVQIIKKISEDISSSVSKKQILTMLKETILDHIDGLTRNNSVSLFLNNLQLGDIEIINDKIYLVEKKETDFFTSLLTPVESKSLWRYTSKNSLFFLLKEHTQNMLSLTCMNDISEIDYAEKYIGTRSCVLKQNIEEANQIFILSCCDETMSDDLMMWRLYAQDAEGVSLKYHVYKNVIDNDYFYLAKVSYGEKDAHPELDLIKGLMSLPSFRFHKWMIWKHFFKPYHFNYEKEIRLIYYEHDESRAKQSVWVTDNKSGIVAPMKLFCLEYNFKPRYPLALTAVLIGPKSNEAPLNLVQFEKMYREANIFCPGVKPEFKLSEIDIYR